MEKIYTNDKKDKSIFQQIFKTQLSKKLSVAMVLVSFFSFMMMGINGVSYAAVPEIPTSGLGDSFTTGPAGERIFGSGVGANNITILGYTTKENGYPIYCLERNVNYLSDTVMQKKEKITDQGLLYIMANVYPNKSFTDDNGKVFPEQVQTWLSQATIWRYLYETNADGNQGNSASVDIEAIKNVTSISWESDMTTKCTMAGCDGQTSGKTFYEARIAPLVANARKSQVGSGDRSEKIRTYNYPQGRITDHRINYTIYNLAAFMDGDIQDCIDHLIVAENAERLKESEL